MKITKTRSYHIEFDDKEIRVICDDGKQKHTFYRIAYEEKGTYSNFSLASGMATFKVQEFIANDLALLKTKQKKRGKK